MLASMLALAMPASATKQESPQAEFLGLRACGGVGRTETIGAGSRRKTVGPVRPGRLESQGPLPSPRFEPPGSNGRYRRHAWMIAGVSASRLGRQAATPVMRQRTSGRSEPAIANPLQTLA